MFVGFDAASLNLFFFFFYSDFHFKWEPMASSLRVRACVGACTLCAHV